MLGPTAQAEVARRARHLAQASSPKALGELRDLVRGIHPSVLGYRGLVDACAALALDKPFAVEVPANDGRRRRTAAGAGAAGLSHLVPDGEPGVGVEEVQAVELDLEHRSVAGLQQRAG